MEQTVTGAAAPRPSTDVSRRLGRRRLKMAATATAGGLLLALAVGCTSTAEPTSAGSSMSPAAAATSAAADAPQPGAGSAAAQGSSAASGAPTSAASASAPAGRGPAGGKAGVNIPAGLQAADRQVIRTASVTVDIAVKSTGRNSDEDAKNEIKAVNDAALRVRALVSTGVGYVGGAEGQGTTMSITLRVPAGSYNDVMSAIAGIGTVTARQEATQDVTAQMVDLESRMKTMQASVVRVRTLLSKAEKIGDVIAIESELSGREADLESLQRQQAALAGQTSLSTITVVLQGSITGIKKSVPPPPTAARTGFIGGLAIGWAAVRKVADGALTVLGTVIPFLPVVAVLLVAGLIWRRRVGRPVAPALAPPHGEPRAAE